MCVGGEMHRLSYRKLLALNTQEEARSRLPAPRLGCSGGGGSGEDARSGTLACRGFFAFGSFISRTLQPLSWAFQSTNAA